MLHTVLLVTVSIAFQGGLAHRWHRPPVFTPPPVCLQFDVVCNISDYQARSYNKSLWVGTHLNRISGMHGGFWSLHKYFQGENSQGLMFRPTAQFLVSHDMDGPLSLYRLLPEQVQASPPQPLSDSNVFLTNFSQMYVYSKTIKGKVRRLKEQVGIFNASLAQNNTNYNDSIYYVALCKGSKRGTLPGRGKREAEGIVKETEGDLFNEIYGDRPVIRSLRTQPQGYGARNRWQEKRKNRRRKCYEIWFQSTGFPTCPLP